MSIYVNMLSWYVLVWFLLHLASRSASTQEHRERPKAATDPLPVSITDPLVGECHLGEGTHKSWWVRELTLKA